MRRPPSKSKGPPLRSLKAHTSKKGDSDFLLERERERNGPAAGALFLNLWGQPNLKIPTKFWTGWIYPKPCSFRLVTPVPAIRAPRELRLIRAEVSCLGAAVVSTHEETRDGSHR